MIRFVEHHEINFEKWDQCIDKSINGIIYPYSFYLGQVSPGWCALIQDNYEAVMPLPTKKKFGINYIIQPPFVQQLGVFAKSPVKAELLNEFIHAIPKRFWYWNFNLNTFNPIDESIQQACGKGITYELDLIPDYVQIKKGYNEQTLRNLKKAEKNQLFITSNGDPMPIIDCFRNSKGKQIYHWSDNEYEMLKHLIYSGIYKGLTKIYTAYNSQNSFCAGIVFFTSNNKSILFFSGSTPEARTNGAMTAIIDKFIQDHCGLNLTLDFEGSKDKNLARFYAGFGSKECVFLQIVKKDFPLLLKPISELFFFFKK
jgi:hypothetical protein